MGARRRQCVARKGISWLFEPHPVGGTQEAAHDEVDRPLIAIRDQNLVRRADDAAGEPKISGDGRFQRRMAAVVGMGSFPADGVARTTRNEPRPGCLWEGVKCRLAQLKWRTRLIRVARAQHRSGRQLAAWLQQIRGSPVGGERARDHAAGLPVSFDIALGCQQPIGVLNGAASNAQLAREVPRRGEPHTWLVGPASNAVTNPLVDLTIERLWASPFYRDRRRSRLAVDRLEHGLLEFFDLGTSWRTICS